MMKQEKDFYVVGIGASAGGLGAVQQLFDNIPDNTGNVFVIIQHLSPDFKSLMPELLAKHTKMKIFTAEDNQELEPNCIYLNQRNKNIGIKDCKFVLLDKAPKDHLNLPIDILFHMLGESYKEKSIGVILSGTGSDGSRGIKTIKEAGGTILVQEPDSAQFNGMPNSAISKNLSDFILPPNEIAEKIVLFTGKRLQLEGKNNTQTDNEKTFQNILTLIQKHSGVNYKKYKINTLLRRLEKRLSLHNIETLEEYLAFLKQNDKELASINQEFLIGVTSFFRDKEAYDTMRHTVIPAICQRKNKQDTIRVWIPGCSSGEEVYSIAILFEDHIRNNKLSVGYKIFATDIDKRALHQASIGDYPVNNCAEIDRSYLEDYFVKSGEKIQIIKRIRENIVFSYHDVTNDPPFIKVDLISCRNLLIYFNNTTQKSVLSGFQFSLNKDGFLFLGNSESLGNVSNLFKVIDNKHKIFQNLYENKRLTMDRDIEENHYNIGSGATKFFINKPQQFASNKKQTELFYYKYLSKKHVPVSVFVDIDFNVQFILGDFKKWFSQSDGVFSNNFLNMVTPELATIIRNGLRRVIESNKSVSIKNLICNIGDEQISTDLFFESVERDGSLGNIFLVQFGIGTPNNTEEQILLSNEDVSNFSKQRIEDLEQELKENRAELQNVVEELETSNEELQSSNEELMSSNEELQSSNEELQSVNEELYTVNSEFQQKNRELGSLNNDITNLLHSTDIGTLFLDTELNIRKFTPAVKRIFSLEDSDIGRSIVSFASEFEENTRKSIISDSKTSLEELKSFEKEIQDNKGNWYLKRITPFITTEKKIEGAVITFVDINSFKKAKAKLNESETRLTTALEAGSMAWWEMKFPSGEISFNEKKAKMIGRDPKDFKYYNDFMELVHPDDYKIVTEALHNHLEDKSETYMCQYRLKNIDGNYQWFQDIGKIVFKCEKDIIISGIVIEVTTKKRTELKLMEAIKKVEKANVYKNQFLANMSHEIRTPMNGLVGFAKLLRKKNLTPETKNKYVDIIENSSKQLLNLINDIIDVSKIEAGELKINNKPCLLNNLFTELETTFNELKHQKGKGHIEIKANIMESGSDLTIKTDPARLKQVLTNLLGNALKFTNEGVIEFGYEIIDKQLVFKVSDTGIGISKHKLSVIFERFKQLNHTKKAKYDGTGLGLAITKGIVNLLGGSISVQSELEKGSIFTFEIPYIPLKPHHLNSNRNSIANTKLLNGKTILVAEDDDINKLFIEELLEDIPLKVLWANNGVEAVEMFKKNDNISLVLMDINMPLLNGYKAAKQIFEYKSDTRIIAQTAYAMTSDREKCIKNGFVDYISKPIQEEKLIELLTKWIV